MKKRLIYVLMVLIVMGACLCACGKKDDGAASDKVIDVQAAADSILSGASFKDQLAAIDKTMALSRLYGLDEANIEAAAFYTNSNSTAEEIAVIKVSSADYTATVKDAFAKRVSDQKEACKDYLPDEMPKLESAVIYENGNYVVLCVSEDNKKAEEVIKGLFK